MTSYPKIWNLGHPHIAELFHDEVTLEEKVDGSQFSFGVKDGVLVCSSKSCSPPDKMFDPAVAVAERLKPQLCDGWVYRGEYLKSSKHNTLAYDRIPTDHIVLFDVMTGYEAYMPHEEKTAEAARLGLECVPVYYHGKVEDLNTFEDLLGKTSFLGGAKVEGVVIKNHGRFGRDGKPLLGKYVSQAFREMHKGEWKKINPSGSDIRALLASKFCTPARWHKAVQHLAERGTLENSPTDIGALMKETHLDLDSECKDLIAAELLKWAMPEIKRAACRGLPEWYKEQLAAKQFAKE